MAASLIFVVAALSAYITVNSSFRFTELYFNIFTYRANR